MRREQPHQKRREVSLAFDRFRAQLFHILHKPSPNNRVARYFNYVLAVLIIGNAASVALESVDAIYKPYAGAFWWFEAISTGALVLEYLARLWVCVEQARYQKPVSGRLRYAIHPLPLFDLLVIVTYWVPVDLRFLRIARMLRLLKVLHLEKFEISLGHIGDSLARRKELLLVAIVLMVVCIYASAAVLYQLEHTAQPGVFTSIPATFWWAMTTLTTIGYGDMVPITPLGKVCAGLISIFGIGVFALPTAIVTAAIVEAGSDQPELRPCQKCGHTHQP
jgi:voltage-gated potassium channel